MEDITQDVTQAEVTAPESSAETNTEAPKEAETSQETQTTSEGKDLSEQVVPYKRFHEVNEKAKKAEELERELQELKAKATPPTPEDEQTKIVKETLKNLGFVTREEQEAELRRREEDAQLDKTFSKLESKYDGKDGRPKFSRQEILEFYRESRLSTDPEILYKLKFEKELDNWKVQQALSKTQGTKSEASDGSGSTTTGADDLKTAAMSGDKSALRAYLKHFSPKG
jgi:hypothetical protein